MASSVIVPAGPGGSTHSASAAVPSGEGDSLDDSLELSLSIPSHPLGVKPSGNQYTAARNSKGVTGPFQLFPDEILAIFLEFLDAEQLRLLGSTCKFLYAFCRSDDIWKALFIE